MAVRGLLQTLGLTESPFLCFSQNLAPTNPLLDHHGQQSDQEWKNHSVAVWWTNVALFDAWYVRVGSAMHYLNSIHNYFLATLASGSVEFVLEIVVLRWYCTSLLVEVWNNTCSIKPWLCLSNANLFLICLCQSRNLYCDTDRSWLILFVNLLIKYVLSNTLSLLHSKHEAYLASNIL